MNIHDVRDVFMEAHARAFMHTYIAHKFPGKQYATHSFPAHTYMPNKFPQKFQEQKPPTVFISTHPHTHTMRTQVCYTSLPKYKEDESHNDADKLRKNKGFAFVEYSKPKEAKAAVKGADAGHIKLHGVVLHAVEKLVWLEQKKSFRY
jgi:hypothetical protein